MKKLPKFRSSRKGVALFAVLISFTTLPSLTIAGPLQEARVTQIMKDVKLLPSKAAPRPASVNDGVREGTAVRTGVDSRSELTFTDQTITRLGASTIWSFDGGTRKMDLGGGAMLLYVPKGAGGAQVKTAAVTAAVTGTTILFEYHKNPGYKLIVLEGGVKLFLTGNPGQFIIVNAGEMVIGLGDGLGKKVVVDLEGVLKSKLIDGFPPLPSLSLILAAIKNQGSDKSQGTLVDGNNPIDHSGTLDQNAAAQPSQHQPPTETIPPSD